MLQSQWRSGRRRRPDVRGHRGVRKRARVGRTGARAEEPNLSTTSCPAGVHTKARWETAAVRGARYPRQGKVVSSLLCKRPSFVFGVAVVFGDGLQGKGVFPLPLLLRVEKS